MNFSPGILNLLERDVIVMHIFSKAADLLKRFTHGKSPKKGDLTKAGMQPEPQKDQTNEKLETPKNLTNACCRRIPTR
jgi:hypothetical protein